MQTFSILDQDPFSMLVSAPQSVDAFYHSPKPRTIMPDWTAKVLSDVQMNTILQDTEFTGPTMKPKNLFLVNEYLETDKNRNGGGNIIIAESMSGCGSAEQFGAMLLYVDEKMRRFCGRDLVTVTDRMLADKDFCLFTPFIKFVYGTKFNLSKLANVYMRSLLGKQSGFDRSIDIMICNGHFNKNVVCALF